jgi:hypothetical protein
MVKTHLEGLCVETLVRSEQAELAAEWAGRGRRLDLAPGEEIIRAVFAHFGTDYMKPGDTKSIANAMRADEIHQEIKGIITRAVELAARTQGAG